MIYWFISYSFLSRGTNAEGFGNFTMASKKKDFLIIDAEKRIIEDLKKQKVQNPKIIINNFIEISKKTFDEYQEGSCELNQL